MTHVVGPKGQVVIPKALRDKLGIGPGDEVEFWEEDDRVVITRVRSRGLLGRFAGQALTVDLEHERALDRAREP